MNEIPLPLGGLTSLTAAGNYVYAASPTYTSLSVIDVTDPAAPRLLGQVHAPSGANGVAVAGHYAYVPGMAGLDTIYVTDPVQPGAREHLRPVLESRQWWLWPGTICTS